MGFSSFPRQGNAAVPKRLRGLVLTLALGLWLTPGLSLTPSVAADGPFLLTEQGVPLGAVTSSGPSGDLRIRVDLAGDTPQATYVWAIVAGAHLRQRTNDGFWIDWSGRTEDLIDNRFPVENGGVTFKLLDEHLGPDNQGISLWVGYRVGDTVKRGYLGVTPGSGS